MEGSRFDASTAEDMTQILDFIGKEMTLAVNFAWLEFAKNL